MTRAEKVFRGARLIRASPHEADAFLEALRKDDPLGSSVLEVFLLVMRDQHRSAAQKALRLIPKLRDDTRTLYFLFNELGKAYRGMGKLELANRYFQQTVEIGESIGEPSLIFPAYTSLYFNRFFAEDFQSLYPELSLYIKRVPKRFRPRALYLLAILKAILGKPKEALLLLEDPVHKATGSRFHELATLEIKGLALRLMGRIDEALECLLSAARGFLEMGSAYSAFPLSKALSIERLSGVPWVPRDLAEACISLAKKGDRGPQGAARESEAYMFLSDDEASGAIYRGSVSLYQEALQPLEAFLAGATALLLAWRARAQSFLEIASFVGSRIRIYQGFMSDPLLGDFLRRLEPLLCPEGPKIKANLIGGLRLIVKGIETNPRGLRNRKALMLLVYLLLAPGHRIAADHLFSLLWPRMRYAKRNLNRLYVNVYQLRRFLGDPSLILKSQDFYQLEGAWTDLDEIKNLLRLADATGDPDQKEEHLSKARSMAQGELLPDFPYDPYIEEFRQDYNGIRARLFGAQGVLEE
ncbi:MAG: hypothetical protein ABIM74_05215 [candidate division WOR-3 bacterium]